MSRDELPSEEYSLYSISHDLARIAGTFDDYLEIVLMGQEAAQSITTDPQSVLDSIARSLALIRKTRAARRYE